MAHRRFRRKDLKRPDEFVTRGRKVVDWARGNTRRVYQIVGGCVAILVVIGLFYSMRGARARQANEDLTQALALLRAGSYAQASTQLSEVANRWQSSGPGQVARLFAADAALRGNNYDTVSILLEEIATNTNVPGYLRQQALVNLGFALEQRGNSKDAAQRYADAAAMQGPYSAVALLGAARCREQLGEGAAARELYERFAREFPDAAQSERIEARIQRLQAPNDKLT